MSETTDAPTPRDTGAVTYAEKQAWAERHGISIAVGDVPTAFDDAATLWMTKARPDAASASVTEAMVEAAYRVMRDEYRDRALVSPLSVRMSLEAALRAARRGATG